MPAALTASLQVPVCTDAADGTGGHRVDAIDRMVAASPAVRVTSTAGSRQRRQPPPPATTGPTSIAAAVVVVRAALLRQAVELLPVMPVDVVLTDDVRAALYRVALLGPACGGQRDAHRLADDALDAVACYLRTAGHAKAGEPTSQALRARIAAVPAERVRADLRAAADLELRRAETGPDRPGSATAPRTADWRPQ